MGTKVSPGTVSNLNQKIFLPFLTHSVPILQETAIVLEEYDVDPSRYCYTDVQQVAEGEAYLLSALMIPPLPEPPVLPYLEGRVFVCYFEEWAEVSTRRTIGRAAPCFPIAYSPSDVESRNHHAHPKAAENTDQIHCRPDPFGAAARRCFFRGFLLSYAPCAGG